MTDQVASAGTIPDTSAAPAAPAAQPAAAATPAAAPAAAPAAEPAAEPAATAADTKTEPTPAAPAGAPEKYEFKAPEGVTFGDPVISEYSNVAKELGLTQENAQKVLDKVAPAIAAHQTAMREAYIADLVAQSKSDKEFGGDKFDANLAIALKGRDAFGTPALKEVLDQTGLGNHPEIIRAFYRIGLELSEDTHVPGGTQPADAKKDPAQVLYGPKN